MSGANINVNGLSGRDGGRCRAALGGKVEEEEKERREDVKE